MKYYMSEAEADYMDMYQGQFSHKLAKKAIEMMEVKDETSGALKPLVPHSVEEVEAVLKENGVKIPEEQIYTAWYLFHMCKADYKKSLEDNKHIALYIEETLCDPDGDPSDVLCCFVAKMQNAGIAIHWERYL